jgi:single-strand DNA-binding protein
MNINKILITGNVTADPEIRYTPNGKAVLSASLANNEYYTDAQGQEQKVTTFVNLEVWGKPAENFSKLVKKGQELFAEGKLRLDEWTDKQTSARRTRLYLLVENWQFTQYKRQEDNNTPEASASAAAAPSSPPPTRNPRNCRKPEEAQAGN